MTRTPRLRSDKAAQAVRLARRRMYAQAHGVRPRDLDYYDARGAYCFGEAESCVSQQLIALDLGVTQPTVCKAEKRLRAAGFLTLINRRWSPRTRWMHHVYALNEPWSPVPGLTMAQILERGRERRWKLRFAARYEQGNTNRRLLGFEESRQPVPGRSPPPDPRRPAPAETGLC